jgi:secernin
MCDTMAALGCATAAGTTLFAKNSDREHTEAQYLESIPARQHRPGDTLTLTYQTIVQAASTHAVLLSKPHWIWGAEIGANEHGLVIGNEAIFSKIEASSVPGVIGMDYLRLALERAADVDEAIHVITTLLKKHGQSGNCGFRRSLTYHNSYLLADYRSAKVLETVDREWVVRAVTDFAAISNAITTESTFESSSDTLRSRAQQAGLYDERATFSYKAVFEDAERSRGGNHRCHRATAMLKARHGYLQVIDLFGVLRDHHEGPSTDGRPGSRICAHRRENPIGQTTASWVSDLVPNRTVHWVTGTAAPCTGVFKPLLLGQEIPERGPKPGSEKDIASLWWSHEELRLNLEQCGERTRSAFDKERTELETRFLDLIAACPMPFDSESREENRVVTEDCWREAREFESRWIEKTRTIRQPG